MTTRNGHPEPVGTALFNLNTQALQPLVRAVVAEVMAQVMAEWRRWADAAQAIKPLLLSPKQAAGALGISTRTLWTLTQEGELPYVEATAGKERHHYRYAPEDLARWVEAKKTHATPGKEPVQ